MKNGFGNFGYGFGLPKNSLFTEELTIKIYQLRESGFTDMLDEHWYAISFDSISQLPTDLMSNFLKACEVCSLCR